MINYKLVKTWVFVLLLCLPSIAAADREDWYFMFSFGFADHNHPDEIDAVFEYADSFPGVDRFEFAMDIL